MKILSFYVQDERYDAVPWPFLVIHAFMALVFPYTSMARSVARSALLRRRHWNEIEGYVLALRRESPESLTEA